MRRYILPWDSTSVDNGNVTLTAEARDFGGAIIATADQEIIVRNDYLLRAQYTATITLRDRTGAIALHVRDGALRLRTRAGKVTING